MILVALLAVGALPGCLPRIEIQSRTRILEDGTAVRETVIRKIRRDADNEEQARLNARALIEDLGDGLLADFPGAMVTDDQIRITGIYPDPERMPPDFRRDVDVLDERARNHVDFHMEDILIGTRYLYRERFVDAIRPEDQKGARKELVRFVTRFVQAAVRHEFGRAYDTAALHKYADQELASLVDDLIGFYWSERRDLGRKDPVTGQTGLDRALARALPRLAKFGLPVATNLSRNDNVTILAAWLQDLLANTLVPKTPDAPGPRATDFAYLFSPEEPLAGIEIAARRTAELEFGSTEAAEQAFQRALLGVTGTFGSPPAEAEFSFDCAVEMPGLLLRTNGFVETEHSAFWLFDGEKVFPDGVSLELESVVLRPELLGAIREVRHDLSRRDAVLVIDTLEGIAPPTRQRMRELLAECRARGTVARLDDFSGDDADPLTRDAAKRLNTFFGALAR